MIRSSAGAITFWPAARVAAALTARLDPARPPHVGVMLGNTTFFSSVLVAAGLSGLVTVGLNPTRRGDAFARDVARADCQLVLTDDVAALGDGSPTASTSSTSNQPTGRPNWRRTPERR